MLLKLRQILVYKGKIEMCRSDLGFMVVTSSILWVPLMFLLLPIGLSWFILGMFFMALIND